MEASVNRIDCRVAYAVLRFPRLPLHDIDKHPIRIGELVLAMAA